MASSADQSYQQWDYRCLTYTDESLETLRDKVTETVKELGQQGWEMVNAAMTHTQVGSRPNPRATGSIWTFEYSVLCYFKRPIG